MIQDAQVHLAGYVAAEPKFKKVSGDISSVKLRVAYTLRRKDKETGEWTDGPTSFVNVQCWRTLAENVQMSVHKGEPVLVMGRLQIRRFEDLEGAPRTVAEIEATSVGHDLTRGVAKFSRTRWPAAAEAAEPSGEPTSGDGAGIAGGPEEGGRSATRRDGPAGNGDGPAANGNGDGVLDERGVTDFARELSESIGAEATADQDAGAGAAAKLGPPA